MARATPQPTAAARPALPGVQAASRLIAQGRLEDAEERLAQLRVQFPQNAQVLTLHGDALFRLERIDEALAAYEQAWATGVRPPALVQNLAACLTRQNRAGEALDILGQLLEQQPRHAGALRAQGDAWRQLHQPAKALAAYQAALALQPKDAHLYQAMAHLDAFTAGSPAFDVLRERAQDPGLRPHEKARVLATLGKAWMDVGEDDRAFDCYAQANQIMDASLPPIQAELERLLSFTRHTFTRPLFDALSPHGIQSRPQIIVAGMSRSGKSLVESLFRGVAGVQLAGEELVISQHRETLQKPFANRMDAWLTSLTPQRVAQDARAYMQRLDPGENIKITTVPGDLWNLGLAGLWTPNVPIIFCVRDVLDLGVTGFFQQYQFPEGYRYSYNQHQLGRQIAIYEKVMEHWAQVLPNPIYLVDYETLVQDPQQVMNNLLDGLGLKREQDYDELVAENAHLAERLGPVESIDAPMPVTMRFVGIGQRFQKHLKPMMDGYRRIVDSYPRVEPPCALPHPLPALLYDGDASPTAPSESTPFDWQLSGRLTVLDNGGHLLRTDSLHHLLALDTFGVVSFDPAGDTPPPSQLAGAEQLQYLPRMALGDGRPATLHACLQATYSSTLAPLPAGQLPARLAQACMVIAELPVKTVALDQIEGLQTLDWLLLDARHDSLAILEHGSQALADTLLIHAGLMFEAVYQRQTSLDMLSHWAAHHGFRFHCLVDLVHHAHMPEHRELPRQPPATLLHRAAALFIPGPERLAALSDSQRLRLAFLLDTVYDIHDLSYDLLRQIGHELGENYLKARGYFDRRRGGPGDEALARMRAALLDGDVDTTTRQLAQWARQHRKDAQVHRMLALRASRAARHGHARDSINKAIALDPADIALRLDAIEVLLQAGLWWEAGAALDRLPAEHQNHPRAKALHTEILAASPHSDPGARAAAIDSLQQAPERDAATLSLLARLLAQDGRLPEALHYHEQSLTEARDSESTSVRGHSLAHYRHALTLRDAGRIDEACDALWQAACLRPASDITASAVQELSVLMAHAGENWQSHARLHETLRAIAAKHKLKPAAHTARYGLSAQSLDAARIAGRRPSRERLQSYGLEDYLPDTASVLDIDADEGLLLMELACLWPQRIHHACGLLATAVAVEAAQAIAGSLGLENVEFLQQDIRSYGTRVPFDLILACDRPDDPGLNETELGKMLNRLCASGGLVLLEGWPGRQFDARARAIALEGFETIHQGSLRDDGRLSREFRLLRRRS